MIPASISRHKRDVHVLYILYEGYFHTGDITISREHQGFDWVDLNKIELDKYLKSGNLEGVKMYLGEKS